MDVEKFFKNYAPYFVFISLLGSVAFIALEPNRASRAFQYGSYWIYLAFLLLLSALWGINSSCSFGQIKSFFQRHCFSLIYSALFVLLIYFSVGFSFTIFSDEANLMNTSWNYFSHQQALLSDSQVVFNGTTRVLESTHPIRPGFFSFLVSVLHLITGYRVENVFIFNGILVFLLSFLVLSHFQKCGDQSSDFASLKSKLLASSTHLLLFSAPIISLSSASGGFDFFFLSSAILFYFTGENLIRDSSEKNLLYLLLSGLLLIQSRYEAIAFFGLAIFFFFFSKKLSFRDVIDQIKVKWLLAVTPLFLAPLIWQRIARSADQAGAHNQYYGVYKHDLIAKFMQQGTEAPTFSIKYLGANLKSFFVDLTNLSFSTPFNPIVWWCFILSFLFLLFRWSQGYFEKTTRKNEWLTLSFSTLLVITHFLILMLFISGESVTFTQSRLFVFVVAGMSLLIVQIARTLLPKYIYGLFALSLVFFGLYHPYAMTDVYKTSNFAVRSYRNVLPYLEAQPEKNIAVVTAFPSLYTMHGYSVFAKGSFNAHKAELAQLYQSEKIDRIFWIDEYRKQDLALVDQVIAKQNFKKVSIAGAGPLHGDLMLRILEVEL